MIRIGFRTILAKSCVHCGVLKDTCDFYTDKGYSNSWCKLCSRASSDGAKARLAFESAPSARNKYSEWPVGDLHTLTVMTTEGFSALEIAKELGRTVEAIYSMRRSLKNETKRNSIYTDEE